MSSIYGTELALATPQINTDLVSFLPEYATSLHQNSILIAIPEAEDPTIGILIIDEGIRKLVTKSINSGCATSAVSDLIAIGEINPVGIYDITISPEMIISDDPYQYYDQMRSLLQNLSPADRFSASTFLGVGISGGILSYNSVSENISDIMKLTTEQIEALTEIITLYLAFELTADANKESVSEVILP